jgi:acetoin utilization protein AcuB
MDARSWAPVEIKVAEGKRVTVMHIAVTSNYLPMLMTVQLETAPMFVQMYMVDPVVTIGADAPLTEAAELMSRHRIRRLPVLEPTKSGPRLAGILSASDILRASPPEINPFSIVARDAIEARALHARIDLETVGHAMHRRVHTTTPDAPIESAARTMRDHKIGALPVLRQEKLVGLVTESDIFRAFVSMLESEHGARITFDLSRGEDPFPIVAELTQRHGLQVHSYNTSRFHKAPVCVVQVVGTDAKVSAMLDDVWASHHHVLQVQRLG